MDTYVPSVSIEEIREEIGELETAEERIGYLIELGQSLPDLPAEFQTEQNRVLGCQSMVWVVPTVHGGKIYFAGSSDAPMVRGLVAILLSAYSGKTPTQITSFRIEDLFEQIKLQSFLTPMRSNGLYSMVQRIRSIAEFEMGVPEGQKNMLANARSESRVERRNLPRIEIAVCRGDFPILSTKLSHGEELAYLDNAASSQRPSSVIDCISRTYQTYYANVHRSGHELAARSTTEMEAAREATRNFVNASAIEEIVFTSGTTASINLVARSWGDANLRAGDEIILTEMEHHSNIVPWQQVAARTGATIRWVPITDDFQLDLEQFSKILSSKTKLVACTAVSNVLGTINPVQRIVQAAHSVGAKILIDAAQAVPHGGIDVEAWNADWVTFSGHKMLGPTGVGVLYGKRSTLESMQPFLGGGNMIKSVTKEGFVAADLPHRFEAGTAPIAEVIAMKPAIEYLTRIGYKEILAHEQQLARHAHEALLNLPRVRLLGPSIEQRTGIVSFVVAGIHAQEVGEYLNAAGIAIRVGHHCAMPLHERLGVSASCRASFYFYNTLEEVDRFVGIVARLSES